MNLRHVLENHFYDQISLVLPLLLSIKKIREFMYQKQSIYGRSVIVQFIMQQYKRIQQNESYL